MITASQHMYAMNELVRKNMDRELGLVKALWFYAHKANYIYPNDGMDDSAVETDLGSIARKAISEFSGMDKFLGSQKEATKSETL